MPRDPHTQREDERAWEDDQDRRRQMQEQAERAMEKASMEGYRQLEGTLFGTALRLKTLKDEHTHEGFAAAERAAENRKWIAEQLASASVDYDDVQAVAFGTAVELASLTMDAFRTAAQIDEANMEAFLTGRYADLWIDAAMTIAVHLKGEGRG